MNIYGYDVPHLPVALLGWLATGELRMWMYGNDTIHGLLRLAHLIGAGGFLGTVLVVNLKQIGCYKQAQLAQMRRPLLEVLEVSFWATVTSGTALFLYDPIGIGLHTMFLPKLVLTVLGFALAKWPTRSRPRPVMRPAFAGSSMAIWLLVMGCSTWNQVERLDPHATRHPVTLPR
jgi:hypothetical protein